MDTTTKKSRPIGFLMIVVFLQAAVDATCLLDLPVARHILGFVFLTFVPGFLLLRLIGFKKSGIVETVLFSAGLSISSLMLVGLLVNGFSPFLGISRPLAETPLLVVMNGFVLTGATVSYLWRKNPEIKFMGVLKISPSFLLPLLLLISLPIIGVAGAIWVTTGGSNAALLFMLIAIALMFAGIVLKKGISPQIYILAVFSISVALLFFMSLASNHIFGTDIHDEAYVAQTTLRNSYWDPTFSFGNSFLGREQSMLSVSVLPTFYSTILNVSVAWVLKIVYPLIFSLVPVGLYKLWSSSIEKKTAFIAAFLVVSQVTFFTELLGVCRQMIGELFFVLLFLVILNRERDPTRTKIYFVFFSFALIVSHYALSVIFLSFIFAAWLYALLFKKKSVNLRIAMIVVFFVMMFSWYIYISSSSTFEDILLIGDYVYRGIGDFFNPASRGVDVMRGLGVQTVGSSWQLLSRVSAYLTEIFIVIGFVALIAKVRKSTLNKDYVVFSTLSMLLLAICIVLPRFASTMNMTRFYHIVLFFAAPFFVLGCSAFVSFLLKKRREICTVILVAGVLVPYFLFQTGFIYEVVKEQSWSVPLSRYRMDDVLLRSSFGYVDGESVSGAQWLSNKIDQRVQVLADRLSSAFELRSYGMLDPSRENMLSNTSRDEPGMLLYMDQLNVVDGKVVGNGFIWNSSDFASILTQMDKVYSNGGCDIFSSVVQKTD